MVAVVLLAACYHPAAETGIPCSEDFTCPGQQQCDQAQQPPVCVDHLVDAGASDAPPACRDGCPAAAPICDLQAQTCRGCVADAECTGGVCHEYTGTCVEDAAVLFVAPMGTGTACTRMAPCNLTTAMNMTTPMKTFVRVADGAYTTAFNVRQFGGNTAPVVISGVDRDGGEATLTTANGEIAKVDGPAFLEGVSIEDSNSNGIYARADVTLYRVAITGSQQAGVDARIGTLRIIESVIGGNALHGVLVQNGGLEISRSVIGNNGGGGISATSASVSITNTWIIANGTSTSITGGVRLANPLGASVFRFNTVASNTNSGSIAPGVQCDAAAEVADSIINANNLTGSGEISTVCTSRYSLFTSTAPAGPGNRTGNPQFLAAGNLHIKGTSPARDAADPAATEMLDIDGDARPVGSARDIGADEFTP